MTSRTLAIAISGLMLAACGQDDGPDFCGDHALFHGQHQNETAELVVEMSAQGRIDSSVQMLYAIAGEAATNARLGETDNVFRLDTATACSDATVEVESDTGTVLANYASECGADNELKQVNVLLFDAFPELDEVMVHVTTPVTEKHFIIHRQCERAIFRWR